MLLTGTWVPKEGTLTETMMRFGSLERKHEIAPKPNTIHELERLRAMLDIAGAVLQTLAGSMPFTV